VALLVGSLLVIFAGAGLVLAQPPGNPANPVRTLPAVVVPGQEFQVTVTFTAPANLFNNIGFEDSAPVGWSVSVDVNWCTPIASWSNPVVPWSTNKAEYLWDFFNFYSAGTPFTGVYRVRVPSDAVPGTYTFNGLIRYYIDMDGPYEEAIGGDQQIRVGSGAVGFTVYPVNKLRVLGPWIALGAAIIFGFGASLLVVMRRRSTQT
jgi:hypothetical protein